MPLLPDELLTRLHQVADEMTEIWSERGHNVGTALGADRAFKVDNRPRSALSLSLLRNAFAAGASRAGVQCDPVRGGALELHASTAVDFAVIRLRKALRRRGGSVSVIANRGSTWGGFNEEALIAETPYVFAYMLDDDQRLTMFIAEVLDVTDGNPGELVLGPRTALGSSPGPSDGGFKPDEDDALPGFDEFDSEDDEGEGDVELPA